jgi:hypothetical protein
MLALAPIDGCAARAVSKVGGLFGGGEPETIMESDVAAPPEMESRHASGIQNDGDTLVGGRFTFRGPLEETDAFAQELTERYTVRGWTVVRSQVDPVRGTLLFQKEGREAEVVFRANALDPAMAQATVTVRRLQASPAKPAAGGVGGGAA